MAQAGHGLGLYLRTWALLLLLTVAMFFLDSAPLPRLLLLCALIGAMMTKAVLIGANFMHLRFEKALLGVAVSLALLLTALALFVLIAPDALRSARLSTQGGAVGVQAEKPK